MRLFSMGDSITQGFMSFAAAKTHLAYPSLLAKALGAKPFNVCKDWPFGGLPLDIEGTIRGLEKLAGSDIFGLEWAEALVALTRFAQDTESYYERGPGAPYRPHPSGLTYHHNVASFGMTIADAWLLDSHKCVNHISEDEGHFKDNSFGLASHPFLRSLNTVLNPKQERAYGDKSALGWLKSHVTDPCEGEEPGVENLTIWLGNNNVLGTVLRLHPKQTVELDGKQPYELSWKQRHEEGWDLWHPDHFRLEYEQLMEKVDQIMIQNPGDMDWKVFLATIPHVTIVPLVRGFGEVTKYPGVLNDENGQPRDACYYKYYSYFFLREKDIHGSKWPKLSMQVARYIDLAINQYNRDIKRLIYKYNKKHKAKRYHLVDTNRALAEMAWKRNDGKPVYDYPQALDWLFPPISTRYYHCSPDGDFIKGGIFSLDGVHPTAIGHGIVAHEFLKTMKKAGVRDPEGNEVSPDLLDWDAIIKSDTLYQKPIRLMQEIYQHNRSLNLIKDLCKTL